jgi:hypothetical protein
MNYQQWITTSEQEPNLDDWVFVYCRRLEPNGILLARLCRFDDGELFWKLREGGGMHYENILHWSHHRLEYPPTLTDEQIDEFDRQTRKHRDELYEVLKTVPDNHWAVGMVHMRDIITKQVKGVN